MKISACLIVKNEESCIQRCVQSIADADEIVILDTGSTDGTKSAVESLGMSNIRFVENAYKWRDDFADARNHALSYCTGDWILIIDADEVLTEGSMTVLRESIASARGRTLFLQTRSESSMAVHRSIRAFKRGVEYVGAAHELPNANDGESCDAEIVYGYSPAHDLDPDRMLRILSKQYVRNPNDSRTIYYLAREYWYRKDYKEAEILFSSHVATSKSLSERADAYLYLARIFWKTSRGDEARRACMDAITINANFREALLFMAELSFEHNAVMWRQFASMTDNSGVLFVRS